MRPRALPTAHRSHINSVEHRHVTSHSLLRFWSPTPREPRNLEIEIEMALTSREPHVLAAEPAPVACARQWQHIKPHEDFGGHWTADVDEGATMCDVAIPVADFGCRLYLGGEVRMTVNGARKEAFRLPWVPPPPGAALLFRLLVDPADAWETDDGSPFVLVTSVEVRP